MHSWQSSSLLQQKGSLSSLYHRKRVPSTSPIQHFLRVEYFIFGYVWGKLAMEHPVSLYSLTAAAIYFRLHWFNFWSKWDLFSSFCLYSTSCFLVFLNSPSKWVEVVMFWNFLSSFLHLEVFENACFFLGSCFSLDLGSLHFPFHEPSYLSSHSTLVCVWQHQHLNVFLLQGR